MTVFGTRPEVIKMAPVIREIGLRPEMEVHNCFTGQHREMAESVMNVFGLVPHCDLQVMTDNQGLSGLTAKLFEMIEEVVRREDPDWVLAQGDTTSVFVASMVAHYNRKRFGHVEAGLRTGDLWNPYPEEANRIVADHVSTLMFAPTELSRDNLLREGIDASRVLVTGNTIVDAMNAALEVPYDPAGGPLAGLGDDSRIVMITAHRRESFGEPLRQILGAIKTLAGTHDDVLFVYPVHHNPNVRIPAWEILGQVDNVRLLPPLDYLEMLYLMRRSTLILTDSGGVQEEAVGLGTPTLVLRETTERPEGLQSGYLHLVGCDGERIVREASRALAGKRDAHAGGSGNPYGDGRAAVRIADAISSHSR